MTIFEEGWFRHMTSGGAGRYVAGETGRLKRDETLFLGRFVNYFLDQQRSSGLRDEEIFSFWEYCRGMLPRSRSQIFQDLWVLYMKGESHDGYFVEFGACDGVEMSNTWILEKEFNWTGILAEPNPVWHADLFANRSADISTSCVYWSTGNEVEFECAAENPELSYVSDIIPDDVHQKNGNRKKRYQIKVETISLNELLDMYDAPSVVDYISVDTEGSEYAILKNFDFKKRQVDLFTVEHAGDPVKREKIRALMNSNGYENWRPELSRWDDWFVLRTSA